MRTLKIKAVVVRAIISSLICLASATALIAGQAEKYYDFYSFYQGTWDVEVVSDGKKTRSTAKCYGSSGGCNIYVGDNETSVWGFDPKTNQWTGSGQLDGGSRFEMAISRPDGPKFKAGMSLVFTGTIWHPNGQVHYVTVNQSCIDADTTHSIVTGVDQDGKAIPKVIRTHKRKK